MGANNFPVIKGVNQLEKNIKLRIFLLVAAWGLVFFPIMPSIVSAWFSHSDNSHAVLVPFISAYFIWAMRDKLHRIQVQGSGFGLALFIASLAIYVVGFLGGIALVCRLMWVVALIGLLWSLLGTAMIRQLAFPVCLLFFMVPIPDTLLGMVSFPLQLTATKISAALIQLCNIPVYREGNMLYFLQTQLEVAEGCSGIRSIMSLSMLSVIFSHMSSGGPWLKSLLVLSSIPVAMLANILRVSGTGVLAHFFGDGAARGFLHEFSGLVVFLFGLIMLFLVYRGLKAGTIYTGQGAGNGQ